MKRLAFALALVLFALPAAVFADDAPSAALAAPARPAMTPAQRQAMFKTMISYRAKELQLHKQLRSQLLGALSPAHLTAVGNAIGALAVSASPDPVATAKQIDSLLSPGEQQSVLTASKSFMDQSRALREQMSAELKAEMPSPPGAPARPMSQMHPIRPHANASDAGTLLLTMLDRAEPMTMLGHGFGMRPGMAPPGGPPPGSSPDGVPPDGPPPPR